MSTNSLLKLSSIFEQYAYITLNLSVKVAILLLFIVFILFFISICIRNKNIIKNFTVTYFNSFDICIILLFIISPRSIKQKILLLFLLLICKIVFLFLKQIRRYIAISIIFFFIFSILFLSGQYAIVLTIFTMLIFIMQMIFKCNDYDWVADNLDISKIDNYNVYKHFLYSETDNNIILLLPRGVKLNFKHSLDQNNNNLNNEAILLISRKKSFSSFLLEKNGQQYKIYLMVYKDKINNIYKVKAYYTRKKYNKKFKKCAVEETFTPFKTIKSLKNVFFNSNTQQFALDTLKDNHSLLLIGKPGTGKTTLISKYLPGINIRINIDHEHRYDNPSSIILIQMYKQMGFLRKIFVKIMCSLKFNVLSALALIPTIYVSLQNFELFDYKTKMVNYPNLTLMLIALISIYLAISYLYIDIVVFLRNVTESNRQYILNFILKALKCFNINLIFEDFERIYEPEETTYVSSWKSEIHFFAEYLKDNSEFKKSRCIVSCNNNPKINDGEKKLFNQDEQLKYFDKSINLYNSCYLYCNLLYKRYHEIDLININNFRELQAFFDNGTKTYNAEDDNPNRFLYDFIKTNDKDKNKFLSDHDFFNKCIERIYTIHTQFDSNKNLSENEKIFTKIIFDKNYLDSFGLLFDFDEEKLSCLIRTIRFYVIGRIGDYYKGSDLKMPIGIFDKLLKQYEIVE